MVARYACSCVRVAEQSLERLLPHAGRMRLIDRVVSHDNARIVCEADSHRAADHPLAIDGVLSIACGLEYGAQAMAIHGALLGGSVPDAPGPLESAARHGYLVAAFDLTWAAERLDRCATPLTIEAVREFGSDNQIAYRFELSAAGESIMRGRAAVVLSASY